MQKSPTPPTPEIAPWRTYTFQAPPSSKHCCAVCGIECKLHCCRCRLVYYCSADHQRLAWYEGGHKTMCTSLDLDFYRSREHALLPGHLEAILHDCTPRELDRLETAVNNLRKARLIFEDQRILLQFAGEEPRPYPIQRFQEEEQNIICSSCVYVAFMAMLRFVDRNSVLHGELFGMMLVMRKYMAMLNFNALQNKELYYERILGFEVGPPKQNDSTELYVMNWIRMKTSKPHLFISALERNNFAIFVQLSDMASEKDFYGMSDKTGSPGKLWQVQTSKPKPSASHSFLIVSNLKQFAIVQAYFGHYRYEDWLDFEQPLKPCSNLPQPISSSWQQPVLERPEYRGVFGIDVYLKLVKALFDLTVKGDHASAYAAITGIRHKNVPESFYVSMFCINFDHGLLVQ